MQPRSAVLSVLALLATAACGSTAQEQANTVVGNDETGSEDQTPARVATSGGESPAPTGACASAGVRPIYFEYDDNTLSSSVRDQLTADARCIQSQGAVEVSLVGATDPRGTEEYNLALGERRARSVADYLSSLGVARSRLRIRSVGEEMASGETETAWARDRRVSQD